jgi:ubiquitin carboxyl-terminal hydrolase 7
MLQVEVTFCDKNQPNDEGFTLPLSLKMKYDEFARKVGAHLNYDPEKLQFFRANPSSQTGNNNQNNSNTGANTNANNSFDFNKASSLSSFAIKYNPEFVLRDAFGPMQNKQFQQQQQHQQTLPNQKRLYYQKLNLKVFELEERRQFRVTWISANFKVEKEMCLMPSKKVYYFLQHPLDL